MRKLDPLTGKEIERVINSFNTTDDIAHPLVRNIVEGRALVLVAAVSEVLALRHLSLIPHGGPGVCT